MSDIITVRSGGGSKSDEEIRGQEILLQSVQSYQALRSYVGTTTVTSGFDYGTMKASDSSQAHVMFTRPGRILIDGKDTSGYRFRIVCFGSTVWESHAAIREGAFSKTPQISEALFGMMGAADGAATVIPSILMEIKWSCENMALPSGQLLPAFASRARFDGEESLDGNQCFRVVCERPIATWIFWVDSINLLLRQMTYTESEGQMSTQRTYGAGGYSGKILTTTKTEVYTIEGINVDLEESLFQVPSY